MSRGRDLEQAALAVVCLVALLLAAAVTPGAVGVDPTPEDRPGDRPVDPPDDGPGTGPSEPPGTPGDRPGPGLTPDPDGTSGGTPVDRPGTTPVSSPGPGTDPGGRLPPEYSVTVDPDPVPGRVVTVTVLYRGRPVVGAAVAFNGRAIGRTDRSGRVTGRVPYVDDLVVQVTPPEDVRQSTR